ncbi:MAG: CFI-box-CTERM domain-containing protein [Dehalococcoidia bacterium]
MKAKMFSTAMVLLITLAAMTGPLAGVAAADSQNYAWGVTGVNFGGPNDYSEVFKVDPADGIVTIVGAYTGGSTYADIAMTPNSRLYTVGLDADGVTGTTSNFYDLYRLDPATGAVIGTWLDVFRANGLKQVNALAGESDTSLLAIEGGGVNNPHLLRINLDGSGDYSSLTDLGTLPTGYSGGDLDRDPFTGKWYGAFEGTGQTEIWELNVANPAASTLASAHSVTYLAGLSFRPSGTTTSLSLAGSWNDQNLYEVNVNTSSTTLLWDLSSSLHGNIFGLSPMQPESVTAPNTPAGPSSGGIGQSLAYSTEGAASNLGHSLEYRFDWGDGSYSGWSSSSTASHFWSAANTYIVKAQARCATHTGIVSGWSSGKSVTIADVPPAVTTNAASAITSNTSTLNGTLSDLGTATSVDVHFEYGTDTLYGTSTGVLPMTAIDTFFADISSLTPGTTYHFRAVAVGDGTDYGSDVTFTTGTTPPAVATNAASAVASSSSTLNGTLSDLGTASPVAVSFEWATDAYYTTNGNTYDNETTPAGSMGGTGAFNEPLASLIAGTTYHFRAKAVGDGTSYGSDVTFVTGTTAPNAATDPATAVTTSSSTLHGVLNDLGTASSVQVSFEWGTTTSYGSETIAQTLTGTGPFTANLIGLASGTSYHFRAKAVGDGTVFGGDRTFTTGTTPPAVTTDAASAVTSSSSTLNGTLDDLGTASSVQVSFEWGLDTSYGNETTAQPLTGAGTASSVSVSAELTGMGTGSSVLVSAELTSAGPFTADLTGLSGGTTYHFRTKAVGDDTSYGDDITFTTAAAPGEGGSGCFIATAALGPDDSSVQALRTFRDTHLATNPVGSGFVSAYYKLSPPVAGFIDDHPALKPAVRGLLVPAVVVTVAALNIALWQKLMIVVAMLFWGVGLIIWLRTRAILAEE